MGINRRDLGSGPRARCVTCYAFVLKVAGEMGMLMNEV